jgi:hypothetical protein
MKIVLTIFITFALAASVASQNNMHNKHDVALLFGLNQPLLLNGFNAEINYFTPKFVFDYSHGVSLELFNTLLPEDVQKQNLAAHLPYSTGLGIGYRFTRFLNLRVEPKWHRFEMYYNGEIHTPASQIIAYNTFTLGIGLYGRWIPFKNSPRFLKNFMIAPSIRYWPNVSSSLSNNQFIYNNKFTGETETLQALNIGAVNTPWVMNISIGYLILTR